MRGAPHCVAFEAGDDVYVARVRGGRPDRLAAGGDPVASQDGTAVARVHGGDVLLRRAGRTTRVGPGAHPTVSDDDSGTFASTSTFVGPTRGSRAIFFKQLVGGEAL